MATFNTRIQLKYDTLANFTTNNPVLLSGEVALVNIPADSSTGMNKPALMMKVGDGKTAFNDLPWSSALAADVIPSLKGSTPTLPATSITGLEEFIAGEIQDTDTQYQIIADGDMGFKLQSRPKSGGAWTDVSTIELTAPTYSLLTGTTDGTVKFGITGSEQEVAVAGLGSAAYENTTAFDAAGSAAAVQTALIGTAQDASSANTINAAKKFATESIDTAMSTLNLNAVTAGTGQVIGQIAQTDGAVTAQVKNLAAEDIPAIPTSKVTNLDTTLAGKQDTLVFNTAYNADTNKAATMTDVQNAVAGLSGAMHYIGESTTDPSTGTATVEGHEDWVAGDVVTYQSKEYVYDGENWRELGDESSFAVKGSIVDADIAANANIAQSKIANLVTDLAAKATPADITSAIQALDKASTAVATGNKITAIEEVDGIINVTTGAIVAGDIPELPTSKITDLDTTLSGIDSDITALEGLVGSTAVATQITNAINALDVADTAVAGQFVTQVSETDGKIAVTRASVDIAQLTQAGGETIIFNCGNSVL